MILWLLLYPRLIDLVFLFSKLNKDGRVNALYSTPSIYTDAKYATEESWPLKTDDYFPYADRINAYWTGYFTSRPAIKGYVRKLSGYYLAARQLEFFKGRDEAGPTTYSLGDALAIAQHHDAVSGTEQQHVANDCAKRLAIGHKRAEYVVAASLACMAESALKAGCKNLFTTFEQILVEAIGNSAGGIMNSHQEHGSASNGTLAFAEPSPSNFSIAGRLSASKGSSRNGNLLASVRDS